ncbi:MAG: hypothetical protein DWB42_13875 [Chloroflexi bacterium]|nr:hypothetical protein [Chloroflexota bacterium]GIL14628.1 MAG: hypothetical protein BroJett038_33480 [Chloroflexota bacterium]
MGGKLIEARFDVVRALNLRGMVAGSLIADYHTVADQMSAEQYVQDVITGKRFDSNLSKQLRKGFQVRGLIPAYTIAESSRGWGVEIVWDNPDYQPQRVVRERVLPRRYTMALKPAHMAQPAYRSV